nr:NPP1 family protein [Bacillus thuringiensis]
MSYSAHGNWYTKPRSDVKFSGSHPKIVYHKDGLSTHAFRLANSNDEPPVWRLVIAISQAKSMCREPVPMVYNFRAASPEFYVWARLSVPDTMC